MKTLETVVLTKDEVIRRNIIDIEPNPENFKHVAIAMAGEHLVCSQWFPVKMDAYMWALEKSVYEWK